MRLPLQKRNVNGDGVWYLWYNIYHSHLAHLVKQKKTPPAFYCEQGLLLFEILSPQG